MSGQMDSDHSTCAADRVPQEAIKAAVLAASAATHDDGHTDCYYAGILLAAWPFLNAAAAPAPVPGDGQRMWVGFSQTQPDKVLNVTDDEGRAKDWREQGRTVIEVVPASEAAQRQWELATKADRLQARVTELEALRGQDKWAADEAAEDAVERLTNIVKGLSVTPCREWCDDKANNCGLPAEFVLWGKLFPKEALGPRCYDHAAAHAGHRALGDPSWAILDLRPALRLLIDLAPASDDQSLSDKETA